MEGQAIIKQALKAFASAASSRMSQVASTVGERLSKQTKHLLKAAKRREVAEAGKDSQLNVYNFRTLMEHPPSDYDYLRFDLNNTCNLRCVYCHSHRSDEVIDLEQFRDFLHTKVGRVANFQVGCGMEPTMDKRLTDFMLLIADSPAKPVCDFILQTNGILLHKHDHGKMQQASLTRLSVSIDAASPEIQRDLRSGTNQQKVLRNLAGFIGRCPETSVDFITTVTRVNIDKVEDLIVLGLDMGVKRFVFREVCYYPDNNIVDHSRMPELVLRDGEFRQMKDRVLGRFDGAAQFIFGDNQFLHTCAKKSLSVSRMEGRALGEIYVGKA
jgi:MoaA/NifB/PqqE/SkfB family radical SAM enzyme